MARIHLHPTTLESRLKTAAVAYAGALRALGDSDDTTLDALDKLKEVAQHFAELAYPCELDSNGDEVPLAHEPIPYEKFLNKITQALVSDAADLSRGAKQTTGRTN